MSSISDDVRVVYMGGHRHSNSRPPFFLIWSLSRLILSHYVLSSTTRHERGFELTTLVVIGTDCIDSI